MTEPGSGRAALPIVQYWHSATVPAEVGELVDGFARRNPDMRHRLFDRAAAERLIGERCGARELAAFRACAVPAMQADYFRYCAVWALGGVYADVGFDCLEPLRPLVDEAVDGRLFTLGPHGIVVNGFFLFRRPGHPLLRLALEVATRNVEARAAERVQVVTGPWIFSALALLGQLAGEREIGPGAPLEPLAEEFRIRAAAMMPTPDGRRAAAPLAAPLLRTVSDRDRLDAAFAGVRLDPFEGLAGWLGRPARPLSYKRGDSYWLNWQRQGRTIFS